MGSAKRGENDNMGIDVDTYRARIGTFVRKNSSSGKSEKRFRIPVAAKLRMIWIMKYCTSQVSDMSPYCNVSWYYEQNCLPAYCYRGAIESDNVSLQVHDIIQYKGMLLFAPRSYTTGTGGTSSRQAGGEGPIDDGGGLCAGDSTFAVSNVWGCGGEPRTSGSAHQR